MSQATSKQSGKSESRENLREGWDELARDARDSYEHISTDARNLAYHSGQLARESLDPVEDYIKSYPLRSALIAGGVGLLLGIILKSK